MRLYKFGIAGVQEFISQARKIRDLRAGSAIIAELAKASGTELPPDNVIIPCFAEDAKSVPLGNKRTWPHQIIWESDNPSSTPDMMNIVEKTWREICIKAIGDKAANNPFYKSLLTTWIEIYLSSSDLEDYAACYKELCRRDDWRRLTRTWGQLPEQVFNNKTRFWSCTLCGQRPSEMESNHTKDDAIVGKGERLCPVCEVKRKFRFSGEQRIQSTHSLALYRYLRDKDDTKREEILQRLDNLKDDNGEFNAILNGYTAYYAIVILDGDHMGKWLSREGIDDLRKHQQDTSECLDIFARTFQAWCDSTDAIVVVYIGGDDALLLTPLDHLLPLMKKANEVWDASFDQKFAAGHPTMTLHASMVHAKAPLQPCIRQAFSLLTVAKDKRRDCFSLLASVNGGEDAVMLARWGEELDAIIDMVEIFSNWRCKDAETPPDENTVAERTADSFSKTSAHALLENAPSFFKGREGEEQIADTAAFEREVRRIFHRSGNKIAEDKMEKVIAWTCSRANSAKVNARVWDFGRNRLESGMKVALFLARELAWRSK